MALDSMAEVRARAGHWFDRGTMRWFGSRVGSTLYAAGERRFFISSEQYHSPAGIGRAWQGRRCWSVREAMPDGGIETVGEFGGYGSWAAARAAIAAIQRGVVSV